MILSVDFETFYSTEYSLSRMSEVDYIMSPLFQFISCSFKEGAASPYCVWGEDEIRRAFSQYEAERVAMLSHNMRFDGSIAGWHLGFLPKLYLDTLSMARAMTHARIGRSSLKMVSDYLGLPPKGDEVVYARGKRIEDFTPVEQGRYMAYCDRDNENCYDIFQRFMRSFPKSELDIIDWTMRMFIQPQVTLNPNTLAVLLHKTRAEKEACFDRVAHIDRAVFSSSAKFTRLLQDNGVEVPTKVSPATGEEIPALSKSDVAFKELLEDESLPMDVQAMLAARINAKSTIAETRTAALLNLSLREWPGGQSGIMPVPIKYAAAHTTRFGGDGGFNFQNLQRTKYDDDGNPIIGLKDAIEAPPGYVIVHRDQSQIEARMNAFIHKCLPLLEAFANGEDIYSKFATTVYGYPVTKAQKAERFVGKTSILGLGYGMGPERFQRTLYLGVGGMSLRIDEDMARRVVGVYRRTYREIPAGWDRCNSMLQTMMADGEPFDGTPGRRRFTALMRDVIPGIEWTHDALWLPNGLCIAYPNLRNIVIPPDPSGRGATTGVVYSGPNKEDRYLFGGKVTENICQALSRVVVCEIVRRVKQDTKTLPFLTTHDSLDYLVPIGDAKAWDDYLETQFSIRPEWAPELPLASEGGWGFTLGQAERAMNP